MTCKRALVDLAKVVRREEYRARESPDNQGDGPRRSTSGEEFGRVERSRRINERMEICGDSDKEKQERDK